MRKTKCWQIILGVFALLGISWTSSQLKNKSDASSRKLPVGKWRITLKENPIEKELSITEDGEVFLDSSKVKGKVVHASQHYFLYEDHYGYNLELFKNDSGNFMFYDEADDKLYDVESI